MDRQFRILWGPTLETVLDFSWPVVGAAPLFWRGLRMGSERLDGATTADVSVTGKDYFLGVTAKWFDLQHQTGAIGLQAFIDWANAGNAFTLVPDPIGLPTLTVTGCYLDAPFDSPSWSVETGGEMTVDLVIRHPTQDLGLAWRGLWFEYVAGQSLTDPIVYTQTRASIKYELGPDGYLHQLASGVLADGHYPSPLAGLQTTLLENAVANDITAPEDLNNIAWVKSLANVTINNAKAPDQNITADLLVEDTTVTAVHAVGQAITVTAGDKQTGMVFIRPSGRFWVLFGFNDAANGAGGNKAMFQTDLSAASPTVQVVTLGTGVVDAAKIIPMAGGWFCLWIRGSVGVAATYLTVRMGDGTGTFSYTGDGASGMYVWGATAVHTAAKSVASYTPTTGVADALSAAWGVIPQAQWIYVKLVHLCLGQTGNGYLVTLEGNTDAAPRLVLFWQGSTNQYTFYHNGTGSGTQISAVATPAMFDVVELLAIVYADGHVELHQSINGGAEAVVSNGAIEGFGAAWTASGPAKIWISAINGGSGQILAVGANRIKTGPYVATGFSAITTITAARAA